MQGERGDHEAEEDRQTQDQAGGLQEPALDRAPGSAEPVLAQEDALVAARKLLEIGGRGLDEPAHEIADWPAGGIEQDDQRKEHGEDIRDAPFGCVRGGGTETHWVGSFR